VSATCGVLHQCLSAFDGVRKPASTTLIVIHTCVLTCQLAKISVDNLHLLIVNLFASRAGNWLNVAYLIDRIINDIGW
jgi:hypothetical protein